MFSDEEDRMPHEWAWVHLQPFLRFHGYEMRARYQPDWVPSWRSLTKPSVITEIYEDGVPSTKWSIMDAIRVEDNAAVTMKLINPLEDASEIYAAYFSESPRCDEPRNHYCPVLEVLQPDVYPDKLILVMPRLLPWHVWPFDRVGEIVEFFAQIFEGMAFMHEHQFAHLDVGVNNIMMDGMHLFKEPNHPATPARSLHSPSRKARHFHRHQSKVPIKYYFIDFEGSVQFESLAARHAVVRAWRGDKTVPEESSPALLAEPHDPFALDIYCLGNLIREHCLAAYKNVEFIRPLVEDMVQTDPSLRPTAGEVVSRFEEIRVNISPRKLANRARPHMDYFTKADVVRKLMDIVIRQQKEAKRERKLAARAARAARPPAQPLAHIILSLRKWWFGKPQTVRDLVDGSPAAAEQS